MEQAPFLRRRLSSVPVTDEMTCSSGHYGCWPTDDPRHYGEPLNKYTPSDTLGEMFDGIDSIEGLAIAMKALRRRIKEMAAAGWILEEPIFRGALYFRWDGPGTPPAADSARDDLGLQAHERLAQNYG